MNVVEVKPGYDEVFTVTGYYQGPLRGVANCKGQPHFYDFYDCVLDQKEGERFLYRLTPIPPDILGLALEDWAIWRTWEAAFHSGKATLQSYPALPQDIARHAEIKPVLDSALRIDPQNCIIRQGLFEVIGPSHPKGLMPRFQVRWTEPDS